MHNPLTKITILFAMLVVIFAGISPRAFHSSTISPMGETLALAADQSFTLFDGSQPHSLAVTQSLGSLDPIAWDDLQIAGSHPPILQLFTTPSSSQPDAQIAANPAGAHLIDNPSTTGYGSHSITYPRELLSFCTDSQEVIKDFCYSHNALSNLFYVTKVTGMQGQYAPSTNQADWAVSCRECHFPTSEEFSWQFRGAE